MKIPASIRGRFLLLSALTTGLALALTFALLVSLFSANIRKRIDAELTATINTLAGQLSFDASGVLTRPKALIDRRLGEPYGGLYWQIVDDSRHQVLRSVSLWDMALALPDDVSEDGAIHHYTLPGPESSRLIVLERTVRIAAPDGLRQIRIAAAVNEVTLREARSGFIRDIVPAIAALALFLIGASIAQLAFGLRALTSLSEGINRIRERRDTRLSGSYPLEFQSTVKAMNQLLETQDLMMAKARSRAADLAHGLRTPLTVLSNDALTLRDRGEEALADELDHLAAVMRNHVERELALSRITARADLRRGDSNLAQVIDEIIRTLKRTPSGEELNFIIDGDATTTVPVDPNDCRELAGNLLENAVKWARSSISVRWLSGPDGTSLFIEDDGPGVPEEELPNLTRRGWRLDSKVPGTGLGLSIVREIAEVYQVRFELRNRAETGMTGLVAQLHFGGTTSPPDCAPAK